MQNNFSVSGNTNSHDNQFNITQNQSTVGNNTDLPTNNETNKTKQSEQKTPSWLDSKGLQMLQKVGLGTAAVVLGALSLALLPLTIVGLAITLIGANIDNKSDKNPVTMLGMFIALPFVGFCKCYEKL